MIYFLGISSCVEEVCVARKAGATPRAYRAGMSESLTRHPPPPARCGVACSISPCKLGRRAVEKPYKRQDGIVCAVSMACLLMRSKAPTPSTDSTVSEGSPSPATCGEGTNASEPARVQRAYWCGCVAGSKVGANCCARVRVTNLKQPSIKVEYSKTQTKNMP